MTPRRIAYLLKVFPKVSETFIATELAELRRRGIKLRILSLQQPQAGVRHDFVVSSGLEQISCYEPNDFLAVIKDFRPQLLHAHFATEATEAAIERACGHGIVSCRFAYVYPDGPAPYYTVLAQGRPGAELEQWNEIKAAASDALIAAGGTITHHHAVGRYHRRWYDLERPQLFAEAYRAARRVLDPAGIMNPGVLVD